MNNCGCNYESSSLKTCDKLGKFTAIDAKCINTSNPNTGSIIPFASVDQSIIEDILLDKFGSALGFGSEILLPIINNTINITDNLSEAFTVPREGNITAISASLNVSSIFSNFTGTVTIRAQVFHAPEGSNIFTGTSTSIDLAPSLIGPLTANQLIFASANTPPVPVSAGDQLLMVFYISSKIITGNFAVISGTASAGINIV